MAENVVYTVSLNDQFTKGIKNANAETDKLDGSVNKLNTSFSGLGAAIAAAFSVAVISNFVTGIVNAGTKVENARIGLTTLTKDVGLAGQIIEETLSDAAKTPFEFEGLLEGRRALIGAGVSAEQSRGDILALGNAIAAVGGSDSEMTRMIANMQQIATTGKATAMDIRQFGMAGVNIYQMLADATGKNIDQVKEMEVSYDLLAYAFRRAASESGIYAGGLEAMADSTTVKISNLGDTIFRMSVRLYDDLKPAIITVLDAVGSFLGYLESAYTWVKDNADVLGVLAVGLVAYATYTNAAAIATFALEGAVKVATIAQWLFNAALNANPIGAIILAITWLTAGVIYAWKNFEGFRGAVLGAWQVIKDLTSFVYDKVIGVFSGLGDIIAGIFTFDIEQIKSGFKQAAKSYLDFGFSASESFNKGWDKGVKSFQDEQAAKGAEAATPEKSISELTAAVSPPAQLTTPSKAKDTATKVDRGQRVTTINISIEKLIEEFIIKTENINTATYGQIKDAVQRAMLGAVNDSQIIAGR